MQAKVFNLAGDEVRTVELDDAVFGVEPNMAVIRQAALRQQANARQGTHDTKTRAEVRGGGRKPWRQKGTGRARQGSNRSPQWRHGGVVFGPHPRSYVQDMPRKMRRLAIRGVLSAKLADGQLLLVDSFETLEPRTRAMAEALTNLKVGESSVLIMVAQKEPNLEMAASNLPRVTTQSAHVLSIVDMLKHDYVVMPVSALDVVQSVLGNSGGRRKLALNGSAGSNGMAPVEDAPIVEEAPAEPVAATTKPRRTRKASAEAGVTEATEPAPAEETIVFEPTGQVAETADATLAEETEENA